MADKINTQLAYNLKALRAKSELTQEQFAELSGLSVVSIKNFESAKRWPRSENLEAMAKVLGVEAKQLFWDNPGSKESSSIEEILSDSNLLEKYSDLIINSLPDDLILKAVAKRLK